MHEKRSRRQFFRGTLGLLGGAFAARITGLFPEAQPLLAQARQEEIPITRPAQVESGELYAGFILLPESAPLPSDIQQASIPIFCNVDEEPAIHNGFADSKSFSSALDLASTANLPLYILSVLPDELRETEASLVEYSDGTAYSATVNYEAYDEEYDLWVSVVTLNAICHFPQPFPLWDSEPVEPGGPGIQLEKVDFLPVSGIQVETADGLVFHWIANKVMYTLVVITDLLSESVAEELINNIKATKFGLLSA